MCVPQTDYELPTLSRFFTQSREFAEEANIKLVKISVD